MTLPLAIYTANHGLAWHYDVTAISFAELDACHMLLASIPDFDAGDVGYEGIAAVGERAFVIRCFKAPKWDFVGRDALYVAVTWFPRDAVADIGLGALLGVRELCEPMRDPPTQFEWTPRECAGKDVWREAETVIAASGTDERVRFVRMLPNGMVRQRAENAARDDLRQTHRRDAEDCAFKESCRQVSHGKTSAVPVALVVVAVVVTLALLGSVAYDYFSTRREARDDGSGEVFKGTVANECNGVTDAGRAFSEGRTNRSDSAECTTNDIRATGVR